MLTRLRFAPRPVQQATEGQALEHKRRPSTDTRGVSCTTPA